MSLSGVGTSTTQGLKTWFPKTSLKQVSEEVAEKVLAFEGKKGDFFFRVDPQTGAIHLAGRDTVGNIHHARVELQRNCWFAQNGGGNRFMDPQKIIEHYIFAKKLSQDVNEID